MVGTTGFEPPTICSRSRVEQDRHLRRQGTTPVEGALASSMVSDRDRSSHGEWHGGGLAGEDDPGTRWRRSAPTSTVASEARPRYLTASWASRPAGAAGEPGRHVSERPPRLASCRSRRRGRPVWATPSGGGRRVGRCAARCAGRPYEIQTWLPPLSPSDGSRHGLGFAAAVSMACSCLASSASISPIATRSSGLMNPSDSRNPPARAIASLSGTAQ